MDGGRYYYYPEMWMAEENYVAEVKGGRGIQQKHKTTHAELFDSHYVSALSKSCRLFTSQKKSPKFWTHKSKTP